MPPATSDPDRLLTKISSEMSMEQHARFCLCPVARMFSFMSDILFRGAESRIKNTFEAAMHACHKVDIAFCPHQKAILRAG